MENETTSGIHQSGPTHGIREQVKEKVTVIVEEKIKDISVDVNLINNNYFDIITKKINGFLESLIISCNKKVHIRISLESFPKIVLFEDKEIIGSRIIPLLYNAATSDGKILNYTQTKLALNDKLIIEINGQKDTKINLVVRYI